MKKDIECLQSMIQRRIDNLPSTYDGLYIEGSRDAYELVLQDIDQLDELEVLSVEWIDKNKTSTDRKLDGTPIYKVREELLQNLLVPKQELPVVPMWFDEWWKDIPKGECHLFYNIGRFQEELFDFETREAYDYITDPDNKKKLLNIIVNELEYKVEEPLYHALIKGHDVSSSCDIYWNYDKYDDDVFVSRLYPTHDNFLTEMSKSEWNGLGINDSNADFVRVEEVEE